MSGIVFSTGPLVLALRCGLARGGYGLLRRSTALQFFDERLARFQFLAGKAGEIGSVAIGAEEVSSSESAAARTAAPAAGCRVHVFPDDLILRIHLEQRLAGSVAN